MVIMSYNITFTKRLISPQFWQNSFDYVLENIKRDSIKYVKLDIPEVSLPNTA